MINITTLAKKELLRTKLSASIPDPDVGLRLTTAVTGALVLVADKAKAGDDVIRYQDSIVLLVDQEISALVLAGRTVDCRERADGKRDLILTRAKVA